MEQPIKMKEKEEREEIIDDFIALLEEKDYFKIARWINVTIPGFSKKNISRVPIQMLRPKTEEKLKKEVDIFELFKTIMRRKLETYRSCNSLQTFIWQVEMDDQLNDAERFALFIAKFPKQYETYKVKLKENIRLNNHIFEHIVDEQQTLANKLSFLVSVSEKKTELLMKYVVEKMNGMKVVQRPSQNESMEEMILHHLDELSDGMFLAYYIENKHEWKKFSEQEKAAFFQLVIKDSLHFLVNTEKKYTACKRIIEEQKMEIMQAEKEVVALHDKWKKEQVKMKEMSQQQKMQRIEMKERINVLETQNHTYKMENDQLQVKVDEYETNCFKEDSQKLFESQNLFFFTKAQDAIFLHYFSDEQVIMFDHVQSLQLEINKDNYKDHVLFFNTENISSKHLFSLEKELKACQLHYRFVYGQPLEIIRKVAFFVEGEVKDEIN